MPLYAKLATLTETQKNLCWNIFSRHLFEVISISPKIFHIFQCKFCQLNYWNFCVKNFLVESVRILFCLPFDFSTKKRQYVDLNSECSNSHAHHNHHHYQRKYTVEISSCVPKSPYALKNVSFVCIVNNRNRNSFIFSVFWFWLDLFVRNVSHVNLWKRIYAV